MRRLFLVVPTAFALASLPLAAFGQRVGVAPAAPPPVVHFAPSVHASQMHAAAGTVHVTHAPIRSGTATPAKGTANAAPHGTALPAANSHSNTITTTGNGVIVTTNGPFLPTYPPLVPNAPVLLPGDIFSGTSCYAPYNCYPVPGFGFDYEHFFAVHPTWGQSILTAGVVVPFGGGGGFYLPVPYYMPPALAQQQEEAPASANANAPEQNENNHTEQVAQQQAAPAQGYYYSSSEPVSEYVFVKRDGTRIFAVAYSLTKDKIQYVSKEGLRRTLPLDALDFDATQKSNEERGNSINLPSLPHSAMANAA